jgi:hypothetical protein
MTFEEAEDGLPNGFHDAQIERISLDYLAGTLQIAMRILIGTPGEPNQDEYGPAELRVSGLYFCSIEPPYPTYPFKPNGEPFGVSGDAATNGPSAIINVFADASHRGLLVPVLRRGVELVHLHCRFRGANIPKLGGGKSVR